MVYYGMSTPHRESDPSRASGLGALRMPPGAFIQHGRDDEMSAVIVGIDAAYWNTNRKDSSLACCESPNLWRSTIMICARWHARRDEEHGTTEARLGYWYRRRRERLERADDRRHEEESHNDKARDDTADRVYRAPHRAFRGRWRRRFGVPRALIWRGQSVQVNVRERRADEDGDAQTVGLASNSTVPPIILSGDRPPTEKRPRRNGAIRPIAVPTARAALMGSRTQLPTASAGFGAGAPLSAASMVRSRCAP